MRKRKLTLIDNARDVLRYAWSIRFMLIAGAITVVRETLPDLVTLLTPRTFSVLTATFTALAVIARLIRQKETLP